jgi:hypothetical protein
MKRFFWVFLFTSFFMPLAVSASETDVVGEEHVESLEESEAYYKKIIEEYKKHLQTIPVDLRKEIRDFRMEIAKLQKEKRELYKRLSIQAQEYLKQEEQFRRKLPIDAMKNVSIGVREKVDVKQTNK